METKEITEKTAWEDFLLKCNKKTFLHSFAWGEFQKSMGNKIWRFGVFGKEGLKAVALVLKVSAKRGTFLFVPHGPIINPDSEMQYPKLLEALVIELKSIAKSEKASFIRISPIWERTKENVEMFEKLGFRNAPIHMNAEVTRELNITDTEEKLLKGMRDTTRYLIRRAPKDGVSIIKSTELRDLSEFEKVYRETVDRNHFVPFSENYLKNEFNTFNQDDEVMIFLGRYKEETISAAMIIFWSNMAFYHHGASSFKYSKIPASYLLQWEAIKEAKKRGCNIYNFWGIAPDENPNHPWRGLTLFKMGFGGYKKEYVKTQDFPLSNKYWLTYAIEKIRKSKRGL